MTKVHDTRSFIIASLLKHGNRFDYSKSVYINQKSKVKIICRIHGAFMQSPASHYLNGATCLKCSNEERSFLKMQNEHDFIKKAVEKHGHKYGFSRLKYSGSKNKVSIECFKHGFFSINANSFLQGCGCAQCAINERADSCRSNKDEFLKKAISVHGDFFDYSKSEYKTSKDKMEIICKLHGSFFQNANNHLQGKGCPVCKNDNTGWTRSKFINHAKGRDAKLYILSCVKGNESFLKVGITTQDMRKRFYFSENISSSCAIPYEFKVVKTVSFEPSKVWDLEKHIHRKLKHKKFNPSLKFGGYTECFSCEISEIESLIEGFDRV